MIFLSVFGQYKPDYDLIDIVTCRVIKIDMLILILILLVRAVVCTEGHHVSLYSR
jgi:hypothetical protein